MTTVRGGCSGSAGGQAAARRRWLGRILPILWAVAVVSGGVSAADQPWPEITASERALTADSVAVPAPAVILRREGRLRLSPIRGGQAFLEVFQRTKILTRSGTSYGSVVLPSSSLWRVEDVEARTVVPDGRVIELDSDAIFRTASARSWSSGEISFALSSVIVGAIVDYRYRLYLDSLYFIPPWYLKQELPVVHSRYRCEVPKLYDVSEHVMAGDDVQLERQERRQRGGRQLEFVASNLTPLVNETAGPSLEERAGSVRVLPTALRMLIRRPILESWSDVVEHVMGRRGGYGRFVREAGQVQRMGREIAAEVASPRQRAERLYRWVRDHLEAQGPRGIGLTGRDAERLIDDRVANPAEQALLLQMMLEAADLSATVAWARRRTHGPVRRDLVDPTQFESVLVVLDLESGPVVLQPWDPTLPFAALAPDLEGVQCLVMEPPDREAAASGRWIVTPLSPANHSKRRVRTVFDVASDGAVSGTGELRLEGHHAWRWLNGVASRPGRTATARRWLAESYPDMSVQLLSVRETAEAQVVSLGWTMSLDESLVSPETAAVSVAGPLALGRMPFLERGDERSMPVVLEFASVDRAELELRWSAGWEPIVVPSSRFSTSAIGQMEAAVEIVAELRELKITSSLTIEQTRVEPAAYPDLRELYHEAVSFEDEWMYLSREAR